MASHLLQHRLDLRVPPEWAILTGLILLPVFACATDAVQKAVSGQQQLERRIAQEAEALRVLEQRGMEPLKLGRLWAQLASDYEDELEYAKSESAYNRALRYLKESPGKTDYAIVLGNLGSLYLITGDLDAAEKCRRQSLAVRQELGNRLEVAQGKMNLAEVEFGKRKYKEAARESLEAYHEMVALKDPDTAEVVSTLALTVFAECSHDSCANGMEHAQAAWSLAHGAFADSSFPVALAHLALGVAEWKAGIKDGPDAEMRVGIEIMKALLPAGHPYVLGALQQYGAYLNAVDRRPEAQEIALEVARLKGGVQNNCTNCRVSVYGLR